MVEGHGDRSALQRDHVQRDEDYAYLKPGQDGTKRLVDQYGDKLLCVRYRFDETQDIKLKTVEIVVDEKPLRAPRFKDDYLVPVHVAYDETELRQQLRAMRARWDAERNKQSNYSESDVQTITFFVDFFWEIIQRKRAEDNLLKLNEELELRVKERTAELQGKNQELERAKKIFVGRELRMVELKERIRELEGTNPLSGKQ